MELDLRVQPGARAAGLGRLETRDDGRTRLKVKVTAPPEDGKANAAVIALLARALRLPKRDLVLLRGETARDKTLRIEGDPATLAERLGSLVAGP
ncbi:MAG: DUF167 domain-containing protein [Tistlia sp.]|uniref:DUF167 domain-containing protein n=1 Tax=Tistlia sp. TaxID=3057121 RepID=UPI0034A1B96D